MAAAGAAGFLVAGSSLGQERDKYQIEVWTIRATKSNNDIDKELRRIADELKERFKYSGFKLEDKSRGDVDEGKTLRARLPSGYQLEVTPVERKDGRITLKVQAERGGKKLAGTTVRIGAGRGHLMGGWKWDERSGDVMIVLIRAR
jgi:hypothetical protein